MRPPPNLYMEFAIPFILSWQTGSCIRYADKGIGVSRPIVYDELI